MKLYGWQNISLLNAVRGRSNPTGTYKTVDFVNAQSLIDAILTERRIEFLGEGLRNNDLMRLLQPIPAKGAVEAVAPSSINYIWPIPNFELQVNNLMTRNDQ